MDTDPITGKGNHYDRPDQSKGLLSKITSVSSWKRNNTSEKPAELMLPRARTRLHSEASNSLPRRALDAKARMKLITMARHCLPSNCLSLSLLPASSLHSPHLCDSPPPTSIHHLPHHLLFTDPNPPSFWPSWVRIGVGVWQGGLAELPERINC